MNDVHMLVQTNIIVRAIWQRYVAFGNEMTQEEALITMIVELAKANDRLQKQLIESKQKEFGPLPEELR